MSGGASLSVIVPAYNYAHYLDATLASVVAQGVDDVEVIVVDDGSTDDTAAVVARFAQVTYVRQDNRGLSAARNRGLREAHGQFVTFLDADDLLAPGSLAARLAFMRAHPDCAISVCGTRQFRDADGRRRWLRRWYLPPSALGLRLCHFNIAPPHAYLLRRAVVEAVGDFDTGLRACEDYDYWLRALALGYEPAFCPRGEVWYRKHGASMSADSSRQWHHDVLMHERVFDWLLARGGADHAEALTAVLAAWSAALTTLQRLRTLTVSPGAASDAGRLSELLESNVATAAAVVRAWPAVRLTPLAAHYLALVLERRAHGALDQRALTVTAALLEALAAGGALPAATDGVLRRAALCAALRPGIGGVLDRFRTVRDCLSAARR
ncbi:MAG: glycosyltransferase [Gammaproteobacteria bacterium]